MTREPFALGNEKVGSKMFVVTAVPSNGIRPRIEELDLADLQACQRGNREALGRFVRCYEGRVFAYISRVLGHGYSIEDLAQEVFVRAYPALSTFEYEGKAKLSTWLLSIAHHVAVDARRYKKARSVAFEFEQYQPHSPEEHCEQRRLIQAVASAVDRLNPDQRDVFVLATFHDLSIAEIAKVIGCFETTVKTRLFRARSKIQRALGSHFAVSL